MSFFPCVLNHSYESSQYEEYVEIDLKKWYRSDIDNWVDDDLMVKSGSAIVLNHSILIIDLHFPALLIMSQMIRMFPMKSPSAIAIPM